MSTNQVNILFPAGRVVGGSCYKGRTKNKKGEPLIFKSGARIGQPRTDWSLGVAYPKNGTTHFTQTPWGKQIYDEAVRSWPRGEWQQPTFSWKVQDGDSAALNKEMRKNCDRVGYPGHWVVWFGGTSAPQLAKLENGKAVEFTVENGIKPGYWVQVSGSTSQNTGETAGMYMNQHIVCLVGIDTVIEYGPDLDSVGFGTGVALPAGVSMTNFNLPNPATMAPLPAAGIDFAARLTQVAAAASPPAQQVAQLQPQIAVQPHAGFLNPGVPAVPAVALPPPVPQSPLLTAKAGGATYAQMIGAGWNDGLLRQHGYLA